MSPWRLFRELEKRALCVHDVSKIKTLMHQVTAERKKRKVADGLYMMEAEEEWEAIRNHEAYLDNLFVYLLALAIVGAVSLHNPVKEEFGSESVDYVAVPHDWTLKYYYRAKKSTAAVPVASRLAYIEKLAKKSAKR